MDNKWQVRMAFSSTEDRRFVGWDVLNPEGVNYAMFGPSEESRLLALDIAHRIVETGE